jgi:hypothetical protein
MIMISRRIAVPGLVALLSILLFGNCTVINPIMPVESYQPIPRRPPASVINLFADLEVSKLELLINQQLDSIIYQDTSFVNNNSDDLKLKAWKDGNIRLKFEQQELSWELPLRVSVQKSIKLFGYQIPLVDSWEYNGQIVLRYKTQLTINSDWSIKTVTASDGYFWTKKPVVKIGRIDIPVTMIANLLLPANLKAFSKQIDEVVATGFDFKKYAGLAWNMLYNPFKIPGDYNAWLVITPSSVALLPVKGSAGHIRLGVAITSDVACMLDHLPAGGKVAALPDLQQLIMPDEPFKINLLTDIPYSTINRMMGEKMGDSYYVFGNQRIKFESFRVYGTSDKLAVETKVSGSIKGILYFTGIPYFNATDTTLRVKELKFDIKTRNLATRSAKWLFNGKIERMISGSIALPFSSNILEIEQQIKKTLFQYPLGYGFELNGRLGSLSVSDIYLSQESVKANVVFIGNLSLGLEVNPKVIPK